MQDKNPVFSVIVPIYNAERYLCDCLNSILLQSEKSYELILVNDGSTDSSEDICLDYIKKDSRIRYINIPNSGVSVARNRGIELARGDYLLFCDSDDYWSPKLLEVLRPYAETEEYDIINFGHVIDKYEKGVLIGSYTRGIPENIIITKDEWKCKFRYYWNSDIGKLSSCEKAYNRHRVIHNNLKYHGGQVILEDFEFVIQNWKNARKMLLLNDLLYHIRINKDEIGVMKRNQPNLMPDITYTMQRFEEFLMQNDICLKDFPEKQGFVIGSYRMALERVKSGRASKTTVVQVVKQLFSDPFFLESAATCMGKRMEILKILNSLRLYDLVAWYVRKVY